jgi:hypothetical protein
MPSTGVRSTAGSAVFPGRTSSRAGCPCYASADGRSAAVPAARRGDAGKMPALPVARRSWRFADTMRSVDRRLGKPRHVFATRVHVETPRWGVSRRDVPAERLYVSRMLVCPRVALHCRRSRRAGSAWLIGRPRTAEGPTILMVGGLKRSRGGAATWEAAGSSKRRR